ncbi:MAG: hypothetical protein HLUCCA01_06150 [Bacteroidetes bacterium HLUCCA01]|nr:MAG: hypothetical protein HLUCCA01_06150 [Bacteroidetes bacterium HLUCCA01]
MNISINLFRINLAVLRSARSVWLLAITGMLVMYAVFAAEISGDGPTAIFVLGTVALPVSSIESTINLPEIFTGLLLIITVLYQRSYLLEGQLAGIWLANHQNRIPYLLAFFITMLLAIILVTSGYLFLYLKAGYSTAAALYAFAGKLLMFFSFVIFLTLIVNIRGTGTFALIYFLILVFVTPVALQSLKSVFTSSSWVQDIAEFISYVLTPQWKLEEFSRQIIATRYIQSDTFLWSLSSLIFWILINIWIFNKKDIT